MLGPEQQDREFFEAIGGFLARQKEDKNIAELEAVVEVVRDLLDGDWEVIREEVIHLAKHCSLQPDFTSRVVLRDQAVKHAPELAQQNQEVLDLIDKVGYATEGIYRIVQADKGTTHIPRVASIRQVTTPLPIDKIALFQFTAEGLRYMKEEADALGMQTHFTRLSITGIASGLTDRQTRSAMEQIFLKCPAANTLTGEINTDYYFFGENIGKVVNRPDPLLVGRSLDSSSSKSSAMSEFTSGDDYLVRVALKALNDKLSSLV